MLSAEDLESLIAVKRREIEKEKTVLGLTTSLTHPTENEQEKSPTDKKQVNFEVKRTERHHDAREVKKERDSSSNYELEENISPALERYIRRYIGLPVMLKAGEYSPNNPLIRGERSTGDALLGLGEYERRRNTLRKIRQQQYKEYLDQQAKKKQEAKEQAERERREREEKEKEQEERERERQLLESDRYSPDRRRASVSYFPAVHTAAIPNANKVDTGVQVDRVTKPLSVAVQTEDAEIFRLSPSPSKCLTQAERELSPRSVPHKWDSERRRSYGDFDERTSTLLVKKCNRDKLVSELRHTYMPSIFDADAIQMRNMQAEKDAAARRQYYQQELKNQIQEQQRIREERKSREKMLEQAEMRRLEEQLRMLRVAQEREVGKQRDITAAIKEHNREYGDKRIELHKEIELEQQKLLRATSQPTRKPTNRNTTTSQSETSTAKLPYYYPKVQEKPVTTADKKPYSFNIPDNSIFSTNYDVDSYLRRNLNFKDDYAKKTDKFNANDVVIENIGNDKNKTNNNMLGEHVLVHELPQERVSVPEKYMPSASKDSVEIPVPLLRHSPKKQIDSLNDDNLSDAMKKVDAKWRVPAVQKNILKSMPNEEGKSVSILTQLGSIRRQLQLEQLKLDRMLDRDVDA